MLKLKKKKQKSKFELELQSKALKRHKKHKGKSSGSRFNQIELKKTKKKAAPIDARIGSKTPISLTATAATLKLQNNEQVAPKKATQKEWQAELTALENNDYLNAMMDKIDQEQTLSAQETRDFEKMMARLEWLMSKLEIDLDANLSDDEAEDDRGLEVMHLLRKS